MDAFLPVLFVIGFLLVVGLTTLSARRRLTAAAIPEASEPKAFTEAPDAVRSEIVVTSRRGV